MTSETPHVTVSDPSASRVTQGRMGIWGVGRRITGYGLLTAGVVGCLLPLIPGTAMLLAGVALLGFDDPLIRPWRQHIRRLRPH
jgi:hypothetical protein